MNTLDELFSWFTSATIRGTLLALAVLALQAALRGRMPARWNYALWLPVVFVLAAPWLPQSRWSLQSRIAPPAAPAVSTESSSSPAVSPVAIELAPEAPVADPIAKTGWRRIAQTAWLAGVVGLLAVALAGYVRTIRRIRRGQIPADAEVVAMIDEAMLISGLRRAPRLLVSAAVPSPAVTGFWRPLLLLPTGFPGAFTPDEARLVVLHELAHLKRHDLPLNWLLCLLQAIHWCNPVLWFAFARIRADREAACDARVLALTGSDSRASYGDALLKLEGSLANARFSLGLVGIFERTAGMRARIRAIGTFHSAHSAWGVLGATLIAALGVAGATRAQGPIAPKPAEAPQPASARADSSDADKAAPARNSIQQKLNTIIIPRLEFREATIEEALEFLKAKSVQLDLAEPDAARRGMNIVLNLQAPLAPGTGAAPAAPDPKARVTVSLTNIPFKAALKYVTSLADLKFRILANAVEVVPRNAVDPLVVKEWKTDEGIRTFLGNLPKEALAAEGVQFPAGSDAQLLADRGRLVVKNTQENLGAAERVLAEVASERPGASTPQSAAPDSADGIARINAKLSDIIIPQIQFRNATIREAVDFLKKKCLELDTEPDPAKRGVNIVLQLESPKLPSGLDIPGAAPADAKLAERRGITASLRNVPLAGALGKITDLANLKFQVEPSAIVILPASKDAEVLLNTKEWTLDEAISTALGLEANGNPKAALFAKGVTFSRGASATWTPARKRLVVRNTQENLDAVNRLVGRKP